jgi:glycerophosphoryl diester phosphodiesterase
MPTTASACRWLHDAGADLFEVDLQLADETLVMSHWVAVPRTGGRLQWDNWRLRRTARSAGRDPTLAVLREVLPSGARLLLDPKERRPEQRDLLVDRVLDAFPDPAGVVVSTGRRRDLDRLRAAGFETWRSVGDRADLDRVLREPLPDAGVTVRHTLLDAPTVQRLQALAPQVVAWTVNRPSRARELRRFGVHGLTTDRVALLARHVRSANPAGGGRGPRS